jgi:hypothetical protein
MRSNPEVRSFSRERSSELTERDVVPAASLGMGEVQLLVGGGDDADPRFGQIARFVRLNCEAERGRIDDDETVAAISNVDSERAQARNLERRVEPVDKRGDIFDRDALGFAIAAFRRDRDEPAGASRVRRVSGSCIGRMPASSSTVATQIEFEPTWAAYPRAP